VVSADNHFFLDCIFSLHSASDGIGNISLFGHRRELEIGCLNLGEIEFGYGLKKLVAFFVPCQRRRYFDIAQGQKNNQSARQIVFTIGAACFTERDN